jgi:hypothetical protein
MDTAIQYKYIDAASTMAVEVVTGRLLGFDDPERLGLMMNLKECGMKSEIRIRFVPRFAYYGRQATLDV